MTKRWIGWVGGLLAFGAAAAAGAQAPAATAAQPAARPSQPAFCANCHKPAAGRIGGFFDSVAFRSTSMQIDIGAGPELLRFDPKTVKVVEAGETKPAEALRQIKRRHEVMIAFVERDGVKFATEVTVKGPVKLAPEHVANYELVAQLVAQGPEKGRYTLIDSRPLTRFQEGHIPTAIHLPFIGFDKFIDRLPKDKSQLVVFYCGGVTCTLSPNSLRRAQALGYTNLRVYREGLPEWQTRSFAVTTPQFLKEAYVDRDIPHVMIDARSAAEARTGHIRGAVSLPADAVRTAVRPEALPAPRLRAPIVVYDGRGGEEAVTVARALVAAGQRNVLVLDQGLAGWQAAGLPLEPGASAATQITFVPKPRPGSIPAEEFSRLALNTPADVLILDVRDRDEANAGMIKGAVLIPEDELATRMNELPRNKRIVTHCVSGVRCEMAYHRLLAAGFTNVSWLNAVIEIGRDGSFKVTPN